MINAFAVKRIRHFSRERSRARRFKQEPRPITLYTPVYNRMISKRLYEITPDPLRFSTTIFQTLFKNKCFTILTRYKRKNFTIGFNLQSLGKKSVLNYLLLKNVRTAQNTQLTQSESYQSVFPWGARLDCRWATNNMPHFVIPLISELYTTHMQGIMGILLLLWVKRLEYYD